MNFIRRCAQNKLGGLFADASEGNSEPFTCVLSRVAFLNGVPGFYVMTIDSHDRVTRKLHRSAITLSRREFPVSSGSWSLAFSWSRLSPMSALQIFGLP